MKDEKELEEQARRSRAETEKLREESGLADDDEDRGEADEAEDESSP
jgi:hypothetical protein